MDFHLRLDVKIEVSVENPEFKAITASFLFALNQLFEQYTTQILLYYYEEYFSNGQLAKILGVETVKKNDQRVNKIQNAIWRNMDTSDTSKG